MIFRINSQPPLFSVINKTMLDIYYFKYRYIGMTQYWYVLCPQVQYILMFHITTLLFILHHEYKKETVNPYQSSNLNCTVQQF